MIYLKDYTFPMQKHQRLPKRMNNFDTVTGTTLAKLEKLGFEGIDVSLEISLFEYGMAWVRDGDDWHFIFARDGIFDNGTFLVTTDWRKEFGWISTADFLSFLCYMGTNEEHFDERPFPNKVYDLTSYWGWENVFGGAYWSGFVIFKDGRNRYEEWFEFKEKDDMHVLQ